MDYVNCTMRMQQVQRVGKVSTERFYLLEQSHNVTNTKYIRVAESLHLVSMLTKQLKCIYCDAYKETYVNFSA
jgi:hypothetical protein